MAVVLSSNFIGHTGSHTTQNFSYRAILTYIESFEEDIIYAKHLCVAMLVQAAIQNDEFKINIEDRKKAFGPASRSIDLSSRLLRGVRTNKEQAWCIG